LALYQSVSWNGPWATCFLFATAPAPDVDVVRDAYLAAFDQTQEYVYDDRATKQRFLVRPSCSIAPMRTSWGTWSRNATHCITLLVVSADADNDEELRWWAATILDTLHQDANGVHAHREVWCRPVDFPPVAERDAPTPWEYPDYLALFGLTVIVILLVVYSILLML
jgi:hypothetical protein